MAGAAEPPQPHDGATAPQPQLGATAPQPQLGATVPQLEPHPHERLQHLCMCRKQSSKQRLGHPPQAGAQQLGAGAAQPQLGAAAPQAGSQAGAALHAGSEHDGAAAQPQVEAGAVQPLLQPQLLVPNMRFKSSNPKLWPHKPALTTSALKIMFHFIVAGSFKIELQ